MGSRRASAPWRENLPRCLENHLVILLGPEGLQHGREEHPPGVLDAEPPSGASRCSGNRAPSSPPAPPPRSRPPPPRGPPRVQGRAAGPPPRARGALQAAPRLFPARWRAPPGRAPRPRRPPWAGARGVGGAEFPAGSGRSLRAGPLR